MIPPAHVTRSAVLGFQADTSPRLARRTAACTPTKPRGGSSHTSLWLLRAGVIVRLSLLVCSAPAATRVWDGGSASSGNWIDANNWNPNTMPVAGDQLVFPAGAARLTNTNNFVNGTGFDRITFTGDGYQLYGNNLRVTNGVFAGNGSGNNVFRPNLISTAADPSFIVTNAGGTLTLAGSLDISGQQVTLDGAGSLLLNGPIAGATVGTSINKFGSGVAVFSGTNTHTGEHTNHAGLVRVSGHMSGTWRLMPGALLDGSGSAHWLNSSGGTIRPGVLGPGRLSFNQAFVLDAATTVECELNGAGSAQYDRIVVTNLVNLGGATLQLALNYAPLVGQSFTLVEKVDPGAIGGTFANLPEGATFVTNGVRFAITYKGGSSNEVVLTVAAIEPTGVTRTWAGAALLDANWSRPLNWVGGVAPNPGDDLVFTQGGLNRLVLNNDYPVDTTFNSITVTWPDFTLQGNALVLNAGFTNASSGSNRVALPLTLASNQTFAALAPGVVQEFSGTQDLLARTLTLAGDGVFLLSGKVRGNALFKTGAGSATLSHAANTYTGLTTVASGTLVVPVAGALGTNSSTGSTIVSNSATLRVEGGFTLAESVRLQNGTLLCLGTNLFTGLFNHSGATGIVEVAAGGRAVFSNQFAGQGLIKNGLGEMELTGSSSSGTRISGTTRVNAGTLLLNKVPGAYALSDLVVGDDQGGPDADVVRTLQSDQLFDTSFNTVNASGLLDLSEWDERVNAVRLAGGRVFTGKRLLTLSGVSSVASSNVGLIEGRVAMTNFGSFQLFVEDGPPDVDLRIDAVLTALTGAAVIKSGAGTLVLTATNNYAPTTFVQTGTLLVDGLLTNSPIVLNGGTLGGNGAVRSISVGSSTPTWLSPGGSPGRLTSGSVTLRTNATFIVELEGPAPGSKYDQLTVTGSVDLAGAALDLRLGFAPGIGDSFTLIENDGAEAVTNTFSGLPQLGYFTNATGALFRVDYSGGDGNDVVVTRAAMPEPTISGIVKLTNGWIQVNAQGLPGFSYVLEATTNLTPVIQWAALTTNLAGGTGLCALLDTNAPLHAQRFFRVLCP